MKPPYFKAHNRKYFSMEKYSLEAKELLSESQMFEVKAGAVVKDHLQQECSLCDSCIGCASACAVCVNDVM